ncbi:MAG: UDP-3-O-acyl-N-acetylglucosamine deacetylase [Epsilonproteobacteria bacterium]|nr:UDP-3-O-acyl-N-acetylglucosamine deacetylase [Campylobacterota bacterium]
MFEQTIKSRVEVTGVGLHSGEPIRLILEPASEGSGIEFIHALSGTTIKLHPQNITQTKLATTLGAAPNSISTIEHFLSAIYAYGIDNLRVYVYGNEMPIMDGSAISFCMLLDEAKIQRQSKPKSFMVITKEIKVEEGNKFAILKPSKRAIFDFEINFDHPIIGKEHYRFEFSKKAFIEEIARARTFGFAKDIQYLQSQNLALGASLENAIGLDEVSVLNPEGLRFEDEFVRHKILDAIGDMAVLGYSILGEYSAYASSHDLNHKLTKKLLESKDAYKILTFDKVKSKELVKVFA